jgi:nicotinate-nucleotide adenylyltransferase
MRARVGILGGTFDPIHLGHLAAARAAIVCARLDELLLVPAGIPPHRAPAAASAEDRLAMARLAAAGEPKVSVSDLELRRPGRSFTVDTLRELAHERPDVELFLVLGWDAARELRTWREPEAVLRLARLVVITRPGLPAPGGEDLAAAGLDPERALLCPERTPEVEATDIRAALAAGRPLDGVLAPAVAAYIAEHRLYGRDARA